jgi:hypothetical protein
MLEESLESAIVRLELRMAWKGRGNLGEVDRFDFEHAQNERGEACDAGEMPACTVEFGDIDEHDSMIHGVISWHFSRHGKGRGDLSP